MLFIYWGWDSAVSVNEETKDRDKTPGRAAVISTVLLLVTYVIVTLAAQSFAGVGTKGIGLANPDNSSDILSVVGSAAFGTSTFGTVMGKLLILLVLTSAAACTQTTILPTARTTLSMAAYKAIPARFAKIHPQLPDADGVDGLDGRDLGADLPRDELLLRRRPDRRRRHRASA